MSEVSSLFGLPTIPFHLFHMCVFGVVGTEKPTQWQHSGLTTERCGCCPAAPPLPSVRKAIHPHQDIFPPLCLYPVCYT